MAKKAKEAGNGEVNKSQAIRELLKANPKIKATEAVAELAGKGIEIKGGLFYIVKGSVLGRKKRHKKRESKAIDVAAATTVNDDDAVATILKLKSFAKELGGLKMLKKLVDALSE